MNRNPWTILAIASVVAALTVGLSAQSRGGAEAMTAARSRQLLATLAAIEANKAAAVDEYLRQWQENLNPNLYDVSGELRTIAMNAPAWQLYAAHLVGDLRTSVNILRGRVGAGSYINTLAAPQPKVAAGFGPEPLLLGSSSIDLVFTPIAPCRVADTRGIGAAGPGARTGAILANTTRDFDLEDDAFVSGQGGDLVCAGLPTTSPQAWALNVTVVGPYSALGALKAWAAGGAEPSASIINFGPASSGGIANGLTLTGALLGGDDITIRALGTATHVILDVVGYYDAAPVSNATVTRLAGTPVAINAGAAQFGDGADCPAGTSLIGGENDFSGTRVFIGESRQDSTPTRWTMWMINDDAVQRTPTVYSRCMDTPLQQ